LEDLRVNMILGDFAQVAEGKLTVVGGGWTFIGPGPANFGIGIVIEVPWHAANQRHHCVLELRDADGVVFTLPDGNLAQVQADVEVGRPPGHPAGASLNAPLALNLFGVPLVPNSRYEWVLSIDGHGEPDWRLGFNTRPIPVAAS
jgi:hypothetical protein